jgi:hypothetical protein
MKRLRQFKPFIICVTTILFLSCSSTNSSNTNNVNKNGLIIDKNNPPDQNAIVIISKHYTLKKWNDINIEKRLYKYGGRLIIPAGNNKMIFDVSYYYGYDRKTYTFKNVELQYDFEPEKKYRVYSEIRTENNGKSKYFREYEYNLVLYIWLYDTTKGNSSLPLKQWKVARPWLPPTKWLFVSLP